MSHTGNFEGVIVLFLSLKVVCTIKDCILLNEMKTQWVHGTIYSILKTLLIPMFLNMVITGLVYRSSIGDYGSISIKNWVMISMLMAPRPIFWALVGRKKLDK